MTQINSQINKINFSDLSNRKSLNDCVRLSKLCAMLIGLRDGTDAEKEYVSSMSDANVSGKGWLEGSRAGVKTRYSQCATAMNC